ncbi:MAG: L-serine ammonia-lyase [Bryobacterales bacterium]|nr:L-serine ammonia-lyase [Bryobacterales bacterium]
MDDRRGRHLIVTTLEEFFKMGPGPSSSHTMGPMRITRDFYRRVEALPDEVLARATGLRVEVLGSLSATGQGHGTGRAALAGLLGRNPADCEPEFLDGIAAHPERVYDVRIGPAAIPVSMKDIVWGEMLGNFPHPNTMRVRLLGGDATLLEMEYYSVGGGFIEWKGYQASEKGTPAYPYSTMKELQAHVAASGLSLPAVMLANELAVSGKSEAEVRAHLDQVKRVMLQLVDGGLQAQGVLPGPIGLQSKAKALYANAMESDRWMDRSTSVLASFAMAAAEENARGRVIVTAPTAGAAGVMPAVVKGYQDYRPMSESAFHESFLAAAAIGYLCKHNATLAGAEGGCQAEIGVASAMAAAFIVQASGGNVRQVANAAESALEHHLGLTCDPVEGYVQVPCIERCAFGAIKAHAAACITMDVEEKRHRVDLDTCIAAMAMTGRDMNAKYKETSTGGLAALVQC